MTSKDFFNLIRWKNLLMLILIMLLIKYVLFINFKADTCLNPFFLSLLILAVVITAAAGYIINDIHDIPADRINKPEKIIVGKKLSKDDAQLYYSVINISGILLGFLLSWHIHKISFSLVFILSSLLLLRYSTYLKKKYLYGNIVVSFLIFLSIIILPVFDMVPATDISNQASQREIFLLVIKIAFFASLLTFLREIVKDMEDIEGDKRIGAETFPITSGIKKSKDLLQYSTLITILFILYFSYSYFHISYKASIWLIIFVVFPLAFFIYKLKQGKNKKDFHKLSTMLKIIMLSGILTIFLL